MGGIKNLLFDASQKILNKEDKNILKAFRNMEQRNKITQTLNVLNARR